MKKIVIISSLFFLFSCAPHTDYYKPLVFLKKEKFVNSQKLDDHYYTIEVNKFTNVKTKFIVSSLPKEKTIYLNLSFEETKNLDSVKIESKRINEKLLKEEKNFDKRNEYVFFKKYKLNDRKWYGNFDEGIDSLKVKLYLKNEVITIPYYFNHKNRMETYPF